jgi:hypothetical protein
MKTTAGFVLALGLAATMLWVMRNDRGVIAGSEVSDALSTTTVALGPWPAWHGSPALFWTQEPGVPPIPSLRLTDLDSLRDDCLANRLTEIGDYLVYSRLDSGDIGIRGDAISASGRVSGRLGSIPTGLSSILGLGVSGGEWHDSDGIFRQSPVPDGMWVCGLNGDGDSVAKWFDITSPLDVGSVEVHTLANFGHARRVSAVIEMADYLLAFDARNNELLIAEDSDGDRAFDVFPTGGVLDLSASGFRLGPIGSFHVVLGQPTPDSPDLITGSQDDRLILVEWLANRLSISMRSPDVLHVRRPIIDDPRSVVDGLDVLRIRFPFPDDEITVSATHGPGNVEVLLRSARVSDPSGVQVFPLPRKLVEAEKVELLVSSGERLGAESSYTVGRNTPVIFLPAKQSHHLGSELRLAYQGANLRQPNMAVKIGIVSPDTGSIVSTQLSREQYLVSHGEIAVLSSAIAALIAPSSKGERIQVQFEFPGVTIERAIICYP